MLIPKGSRKSSRRISPGYIGSRMSFWSHMNTLVIVRNFDQERIAVLPFETYPPLLVDADSVPDLFGSRKERGICFQG